MSYSRGDRSTYCLDTQSKFLSFTSSVESCKGITLTNRVKFFFFSLYYAICDIPLSMDLKKMNFFRLVLKKDGPALTLIRPLFDVIFKNVSINIFRILFLPYRLTTHTPTHATKILCSQESSGWIRQKQTLSWDPKATLLNVTYVPPSLSVLLRFWQWLPFPWLPIQSEL